MISSTHRRQTETTNMIAKGREGGKIIKKREKSVSQSRDNARLQHTDPYTQRNVFGWAHSQ